MNIHKYRIQAIGAVCKALKERGRPTYFDISALDMASAWRKFCTQYFASCALQPNADDYAMSLRKQDDANAMGAQL